MTDLHAALMAFNRAAYVATRAASAAGDTALYHRLRALAFETDKMVDENASVTAPEGV